MMRQLAAPPPASADVPGALLTRARSEFLEMPGLKLTTRQAARLWGVDGTVCERLLGYLVASGFLWRARDGSYLRSSG